MTSKLYLDLQLRLSWQAGALVLSHSMGTALGLLVLSVAVDRFRGYTSP